MKASQEYRILKSLKEVAPDGLHPTYFIQDLCIYQYSARINGLRKVFGCNCKNNNICLADEHIRNKRMANGTTKFYYVDDRAKNAQKFEAYAREAKEYKEPEDPINLKLF